MERMLGFLAIDPRARRDAAHIWSLVEHRTADIIEAFYADLLRSGTDLLLTAKTVDHLKRKQQEHWKTLFESRFDQTYFNRASLIGIKHYEIGLDVRWYVGGYMKIGSEFSMEILDAPVSLAVKAQLIATLDKYIALDMAMAVSAYTALLVD